MLQTYAFVLYNHRLMTDSWVVELPGVSFLKTLYAVSYFYEVTGSLRPTSSEAVTVERVSLRWNKGDAHRHTKTIVNQQAYDIFSLRKELG
jgi:hypothetical protein